MVKAATKLYFTPTNVIYEFPLVKPENSHETLLAIPISAEKYRVPIVGLLAISFLPLLT